MTRHFLVLLLIAWCFPTTAAPPGLEGAAQTKEENMADKLDAKVANVAFASVVSERAGRPTLAIEYPWKLHARASIEVRVTSGTPGQNVEFAPMYFVAEYFKGTNRENIYRCLDSVSQRAEHVDFRQDKIDFRVAGLTNLLGHSAVLVTAREIGRRTKAGPMVIFPLLDAWAVNEKLLTLDLPPDDAAAAGTLHVWFLRGDKVLWEQSLAWPGKAGGNPKCETPSKIRNTKPEIRNKSEMQNSNALDE